MIFRASASPEVARRGRTRGLRGSLTGLSVVFALGGARVVSGEEPTARAASAEPRDLSAVARDLYSAGRYLEAARAFEMMWRESQRPGALFNAGMAREAAGKGNDALAIDHWRRYLKVAGASASAEERADLQRRIREAERRTVAVELSYRAPSGEPKPVQLELRREDAGSSDALVAEWRPGGRTLTLPLDAGEWTVVAAGEHGVLTTRRFAVTYGQAPPLRVALVDVVPDGEVAARFGPPRAVARGIDVEWEGADEARATSASGAIDEAEARWILPVGRWTLRARAPGYAARAVAVDVGEEPVEVELGLRRDGESRARIGVAAVSGAAAIGMLAGGGVVMARHWGDLDAPADARGPGDDAPRVDPAFQAMRGAGNGIILAGAGGGAGLVALTVAGGGKQRALVTEAVLGGLALASGIFVNERQKKACLHGATGSEAAMGCFNQEIPIASVVGLGAGLLGASTLALITRAAVRSRARSKARPAPGVAAGPRGISLSLAGSF